LKINGSSYKTSFIATALDASSVALES